MEIRKMRKIAAAVVSAAVILSGIQSQTAKGWIVSAQDIETNKEETEGLGTSEKETESEQETGEPESEETERETGEPETEESESETQNTEAAESESETHQPETEESESETQEPETAESESETEEPEGTESESEMEVPEGETDDLQHTETECETEMVEPERQPEQMESVEPEYETGSMEVAKEVQKEGQMEPVEKENKRTHGAWDESWFVEKDFRFIQIEKEFRIVEGTNVAAVYESPDLTADIIGEIPYFGMAYILKQENEEWFYVESGEVRGFVQKEYLSENDYADTLVKTIGEEAFLLAETACEKADNAAFAYTHTTVQEVLAPKRYLVTIQSSCIQEYPSQSSRVIGEIDSGSLVYLLEELEGGWVFVESGESRGFVKREKLLSGKAADQMIDQIGEESISFAQTYIKPQENRSCYYTLKSVKEASAQKGEKIAAFASGFAGKLPYIWGGTSLTAGADCSGFVQSVYAQFGIRLPRLAQEQGTAGMEVESIKEACPGDVVYWAGGPHVGIYIGNGQVVQCAGDSSNTAANPGKGVTISPIDIFPITSIRRYQIEQAEEESYIKRAGNPSGYTQNEMELIWAIVAQEDNGSYEGALAVISSAMNRTESPLWSRFGCDALSQLTAPGQYCYSIDTYWQARLNGNVPAYVKQAVSDCLQKGLRNHSFTSFRSTKGSQTGVDAVQIGGNWFFGK